MSRPPTPRSIAQVVRHHRFKPAGVPSGELETVTLSLDEAEALAIADLEGLYQEAAARRMQVSRPTFGRIIASARRKTADAIINGKQLVIEGGPVEFCPARRTHMKIAIAVNGSTIEDHFGQCSRIRLYEPQPGSAAALETDFPLPADIGCRSALAPALARQGVTHVIASHIGGGVLNAFSSHGISVLGGVSGDAAAAVAALLRGELKAGATACGGHDGHHKHEHGSGGCCHG